MPAKVYTAKSTHSRMHVKVYTAPRMQKQAVYVIPDVELVQRFVALQYSVVIESQHSAMHASMHKLHGGTHATA